MGYCIKLTRMGFRCFSNAYHGEFIGSCSAMSVHAGTHFHRLMVASAWLENRSLSFLPSRWPRKCSTGGSAPQTIMLIRWPCFQNYSAPSARMEIVGGRTCKHFEMYTGLCSESHHALFGVPGSSNIGTEIDNLLQTCWYCEQRSLVSYPDISDRMCVDAASESHIVHGFEYFPEFANQFLSLPLCPGQRFLPIRQEQETMASSFLHPPKWRQGLIFQCLAHVEPTGCIPDSTCITSTW